MKREAGYSRTEEFVVWGRWLKKHFEVAEGECVARKALYEQYVEQCQEDKLKPMSSALLGVIVNNTFRNLGIKRLGARGKSEYYYSGLRLKSSSKQKGKAEKVTVEPVVTTQTKWRQWLLDNYDVAPGVSMPRSAVFDQSQWHSHQSKLEALSSSALGKLINAVFPGITPRRLGTRGNSEYHYWGLHLKDDSPLLRLREQSHIAPIEEDDSEKSRETSPIPDDTEDGDKKTEEDDSEKSRETSPIPDDTENGDQKTEDNSEGISEESGEKSEDEPVADVETVMVAEKSSSRNKTRKNTGSRRRTSRK